MKPIIEKFKLGQLNATLETGVVARQATASVIASIEDTTVLVTVVGAKNKKENADFFPLTINYQERAYAAGKIPGGFFKREGRSSENETLVARLIDRPMRPLFPKGFTDEVQVVATVLSLNPEISPDMVAMLGTSAALSISGLPFSGPVGATNVAYIDNKLVAHPLVSQLKKSKLDLTVAGTKDAILMVESEASLLSEELMLEAVMYGHQEAQASIAAIENFKSKLTIKPYQYSKEEENVELSALLANSYKEDIAKAYSQKDKLERKENLKQLRENILKEQLENIAAEKFSQSELFAYLDKLEKSTVRNNLLKTKVRIDGREPDMVRSLDIMTGVLSRTHGSSVFTRGETQALVTCTLGSEKDGQRIDSLLGETVDHFLLHYNFPPYCVGEVGMVGAPKRREIGHGKLAKRAMMAVMPTIKEFPYTLRVVSEITESNGSSSMASVCGSSLALMDAGVPIKDSVAGVAMGLVKEEDDFVVLSDILGDEDHLGDMDFKVAGTKDGVSALQMDIKIQGITKEIMQIALEQARNARFHILSVMDEAIKTPRKAVSNFAPRVHSFKINPDKIRDVIGKGGATIRKLTEETGVSIDIEDDGLIKITSADLDKANFAIEKIKQITADVEVDSVYLGKVTKIMDFGAFVELIPGKEGLVHISQIADERINKVSEHLSVGDEVKVKVLEVTKKGQVRLSIRDLLEPKAKEEEKKENEEKSKEKKDSQSSQDNLAKDELPKSE